MQHVCKDLAADDATKFWGYTMSATMVVGGGLAPIAGTRQELLFCASHACLSAFSVGGFRRRRRMKGMTGLVADVRNSRKNTLQLCIVLSISFAMTFALVELGVFMSSVLLGLSFAAYLVEGGIYNSMLCAIATKTDMHSVSALGGALGNLGAGVLLAGIMAFTSLTAVGEAPSQQSDGVSPAELRAVFVTASVWCLLLAAPLLLTYHEPAETGTPPSAGHASGVRGAVEFARSVRRITAERLADLQHFPDLILFMAAMFLYADGVGSLFHLSVRFLWPRQPLPLAEC